jgi:aubergine-like protein
LICRIPVTANYIRLNLEPGKGVYEYEVHFEPEVESRQMRNKLLSKHVKELGEAKTFDGVTLYLPVKLQEEVRGSWYDSFPLQASQFCLVLNWIKKY